MASILYLAILYGLLPGIFLALGNVTISALFWPNKDAGLLLSLVASFAQMIFIFVLLFMRWRRRYGQGQNPLPIGEPL